MLDRINKIYTMIFFITLLIILTYKNIFKINIILSFILSAASHSSRYALDAAERDESSCQKTILQKSNQ